MPQNINILSQILSNNPISTLISKQLFSNLSDEMANQVEKVLEAHIKRYEPLPEIQSRLKNAPDGTPVLKIIFSACPTAFFRLSCDLNKVTKNYAFVKKTALIGLTSSIISFSQDSSHIPLLLAHFKNIKKEKKGLLGVLLEDLNVITENHLTFKRSNGARELIEVFFYFTGILQFFLKLFIDLVFQAPDDETAEQIDNAFFEVLKSFRLKEVSFWNSYGAQKTALLKKIQSIVSEDPPDLKHPCFSSQSFTLLYNFCPLTQEQNRNNISEKSKALLIQDLKSLCTLSPQRLALVLGIVNVCKGGVSVQRHLTQLKKLDKEKIPQLSHYLKDKKTSFAPLYKTLLTFQENSPLPNSIGGNKKNQAKPGKVILTIESSRLQKAKKNLAVIKDYKGTTMSQHEVADYLEERLKRLYETVKIEGALNQHNIDAYLEQFAKLTALVTQESTGTRQKQLIGTFKESTGKILNKISSDANLPPEKLEKLKGDIEENSQRLNSISPNKRIEAVENIGVSLTEASIGGEKKLTMKDLDRANGTIQLSADAKAFLEKKIVAIGFEKNAPKISVQDFFIFPLAEAKEPEEDTWFSAHQQYLDDLVIEKRLSKGDCSIIKSHMADLPKNRYKRYYNIYPNDTYDDTILMAVLSLFQNNAFKSIKL